MNQNKLIRLTTEDTNCIFDAQFNEEVLIAPNTEIALKSASLAFTSTIVAVPRGENSLSVFHDANERTVNLTPGIYSPKNTSIILKEIYTKLNGTMQLGQEIKEHGLEYLVGINDNQRVEVRNLRAHPISITGEDYYSYGLGQGRMWNINGTEVSAESGGQQNDGLLTRQAISGLTGVPDYKGTAFSDFPFGGGLATWRSTVSRLRPPLGAGTITGFEIGFVSMADATKLDNGTLIEADVLCGMRVTATQAGGIASIHFKSSKTGAFVDTGINFTNVADPAAAATNDTIEWVSGMDADGVHKLMCNIHKNGVAVTNIGKVNRTGNVSADKPILGYYSLYAGSTFNDITFTNYTPSFFLDATPNKHLDAIRRKQLNTPSTPVGSALATLIGFDYVNPMRYRMVSTSKSIKDGVMGFPANLVTNVDDNNTFYDITDMDLTFSTTAMLPDQIIIEYPNHGLLEFTVGVISPQLAFQSFGSQNYLVELLNLPLNSYDSFTSKRGRSNILAVIPQNEFNFGNLDTVLMYEPSEMTYISLTNSSELSLRNIRARIVFPDYKSIDTFGLSSLVLHLRPTK